MIVTLSRRRALALSLAGLTAAIAAPSQLRAQSATDPIDTVKALLATTQEAREPAFMSARLKRLFAVQRQRARRADGPLPGLDFDFRCNCQEEEDNWKRTLRYTIAARTERTARVTVKFKNFEEREATYSLVLENGKWLVDEIQHQGGEAISRSLQRRE
ncbi:DUF3828 domain-containing protein [Phreatobacter stygius]|uniref:DUF3828 domain-containing protein n=1 Tax=Phreatobacter stygius TaxID=1940610 RepID=A0A4D7APY0_9HYPH|nr:DUF3828 domain-containing protein [Phreatobacter stygius]QCI63274.1 DUF3828 domain-containing protein [Phreatobacter stygius]